MQMNNLFKLRNSVNNTYCSFFRSFSDQKNHIYCEDINNHVKRIVLNNPKRRNSLSLAFMSDLENNLLDIERSIELNKSGIRAVIIKSSSKTFSSGHDLLEMSKTNSDEHKEIFSKASLLMNLIEEYCVPVIVSIHGPVAAAGCQIIESCDIAVCGKSSTFSTPGILAGLFCSTPGVAIGRALPRKIALEMIYTGEPINAETALRHGFVNHVVDDDEVDKLSENIANRIADLSSPVEKLGKACFIEQMRLQKDKAYEHASNVMVENLQFADCKEGIKSFLEKRKPKWNHQ